MVAGSSCWMLTSVPEDAKDGDEEGEVLWVEPTVGASLEEAGRDTSVTSTALQLATCNSFNTAPPTLISDPASMSL